MKNKEVTSKNKSKDISDKDFPDYPIYPPSEDIYNQNKQESEIDPEDTSKVKPSISNEGKSNIKDFNEDKSGDDLDIPGSELDGDVENIGSEDEENNGYSIGGDNHNDLEEDYG
jgi:hypothetical protein